MILYDQTRLGGYGVLFCGLGSALYLSRTFIPAFLSAALTVVVAEVPAVRSYYTPRILQGSAFFPAYSFLLGLMLITRTSRALARFTTASEHVVEFESTVYSAAMLVTTWIPANEEHPEHEVLRNTLLRWFRALHVLFLEETQGLSDPSFRCGTLDGEETIKLQSENKKTLRVLHWINELITEQRQVFKVNDPVFQLLYKTLMDVQRHYLLGLRIAETPYPFPLAQISVIGVAVFAITSPFVWGVLFPESNWFAFVVSLSIVWILFATNEAAVSLETPFDDDSNDLPLAYYAIRFHDDICALMCTKTPKPNLQIHIGELQPQENSAELLAEKRTKLLQHVSHDIASIFIMKRHLRHGGHHAFSMASTQRFTELKLNPFNNQMTTVEQENMDRNKDRGFIMKLLQTDLASIRMRGKYFAVR